MDLIKKMICKPERRLTAQEALGHKWFKKFEKKSKTDMGTQNLKAFKSYMKN